MPDPSNDKTEAGCTLSPGALRAAWAIPYLEHSVKKECAAIIDRETGLPALLRQNAELVRAAVKALNFLVEWESTLAGNQMAQADFDDDSGVKELRAALDNVREFRTESG